MKKSIFSYAVTVILTAALALWPKVFPITGNEMSYAVISYIIIFPSISLICGVLAGTDGVGYGLIGTFLTAAGSLIMPYVAFGATDREYLLLPVVGSVFGILIGCEIKRILARKKSDGEK